MENAAAASAQLMEERQAIRGQSRIAGIIINLVILICVLLVLFPFYEVLIVSFGNNPGQLLPNTFNIDSYTYILTQGGALRSFVISICVVIVGTALSLLLTTITAYPLSRRYLPGRGVLTGIVLFTMFFAGGLIPWYLTLKQLGLLNSYLVMILPSALGTFYVFLMLTFFREFPESLEEAARIDGASDWQILLKVVLPTSAPVLATVGLFYSVDRWNDWFTPMVAISDAAKWPLQAYTKSLLTNAINVSNTANAAAAQKEAVAASHVHYMPDGLKMAVIVIGIIPIMCVYPFLQKYFTKGVMLGSIKG